jgi:hypothetical protein
MPDLHDESENSNDRVEPSSPAEEAVDAKDVEITGGGCLYTFFSLIFGGLGL